MTREEFESAMLDYATLDVDAQAAKLVELVEAFANALSDAEIARQERDDVKKQYMKDFLETAKEESEAPEALTDNDSAESVIDIAEYLDLG